MGKGRGGEGERGGSLTFGDGSAARQNLKLEPGDPHLPYSRLGCVNYRANNDEGFLRGLVFLRASITKRSRMLRRAGHRYDVITTHMCEIIIK